MFGVMEDKVVDFLTNGTNYSLSEFSCSGIPPEVPGSDLSVKFWKSVKFLGRGGSSWGKSFLTFLAFKTLSTPAFSRRQSVSKPTC